MKTWFPLAGVVLVLSGCNEPASSPYRDRPNIAWPGGSPAAGPTTSQTVADGQHGRFQPPRAVQRTMPRYPLEARRAGLQGVVQVAIVVGVDGRVVGAKVVGSSDPIFNQAALDSLQQWRFAPALQDGEPVETTLTIPITFSMQSR